MKKSRIIYPKHRLYNIYCRIAVARLLEMVRVDTRRRKQVVGPGQTGVKAIVHVQWNNPDHIPSKSEVQVINEVAEYFSRERIKRNEEHN